jgi:hypothetical protein
MDIPDYKAKSSVRLALTGDGGRRSSVWSLFTAKKTPDVYVAPRVLGGQVKISLHASGSWQVGFTAESDRTWQGDRIKS